MRFLFIILFSCFVFLGKTQQQLDNKNSGNGYLISGKLNNAAGATIFLEENPFFKEGNAIDSTSIDMTGKFSFKGKVQEPTLYILRMPNKRGISTFILENSNIYITGNADSTGTFKITGSKENDIENKASQLPENMQMNQIYDKISEAFRKNDTTALNIVQQQLTQFLPNLVISIKNFISSYTSAYASVELLNYFIDIDSYFPDLKALDEAESILNQFKTTSVSNHTQLNFLDDLIQSRLASSVGRYAPEILQPDATGRLISSSSLKGKYLLIDFWASWCLPCRRENLSLVGTFKKYSKKNFIILSVSLDDNKQDWTKAIDKDGMTWINVSDLKAEHNAAKLTYGVKAIPVNFLIDPNGKIVAKSLRGNQLEKQLESLIR
jgi:thiol-disulfide isomerase/thioredoxin